MIKLITAPSVEPVTLDEAKVHCRIDGAELDSLLNIIIPAARESAEHETGRALCTQTRELVVDSFDSDLILHGAPIQSVTSVKYLDSAGNEQTLAGTEYLLDKDNEPGCVVLAYGKSWPETYAVPNAVRVRYVCGYGDASAVPKAIKQWMLLAIGTMAAQAETMTVAQATALPDRFWHRLLDPYRVFS
ncbi:MAG: phage head-tail connector protein [Azonexus sp.]